jgi:four helix bundle protein
MKIVTHKDLNVYSVAFESSMEIFKLSKRFPKSEQYSLTDQILRSSRSVAANIAEAWRQRKYEKMFISKLSIAEAEAAEVQVWLDFSLECEYLDKLNHKKLFDQYEHIISMVVKMIKSKHQWTF